MGLMLRTFPRECAEAIARFPEGRQASAVLSLLYLAQAAHGRISAEAIAEVAEVLEMDPTEVRGVAGFYSLIKEEPHGRYVVHYCTDLPCALRGADDFLPEVERALGCAAGGRSEDGLFSLEEAMCLAACDRAPMMQVNLEYFHDLTPERLDELVEELRRLADAGPAPRAPFGFGPPSEIAAVPAPAAAADPTEES